MAASILLGSITSPSSLSTKTGVAPVITIAPTVATKVIVVVITSSPGPIPNILSGSAIASVPVPTPIPCFAPIREAKFFSNCSRDFPRVKSPDSTSNFISFK